MERLSTKVADASMQNGWQYLKNIFWGDLFAMADAMGFPNHGSIVSTCDQIIREPKMTDRLPLVILAFAAELIIASLTRHFVFPAFKKFVRRFLFHNGMFDTSYYQVRCCSTRMGVEKLNMGVSHPVGLEKWLYDITNHLVTGLLFYAAMKTGKPGFALAGYIGNSGMCDLNDFMAFCSRDTKGTYYTCCNMRSLKNLATNWRCHIVILPIMFHHVCSVIAGLVCIYTGLYQYSLVQWGTMHVLLWGSVPPVYAAFAFEYFPKIRPYRYFVNDLLSISASTVRTVAFKLGGVYAFTNSCESAKLYHSHIFPSICGLQVFSVLALVGNTKAHLWGQDTSNRSMIIHEPAHPKAVVPMKESEKLPNLRRSYDACDSESTPMSQSTPMQVEYL